MPAHALATRAGATLEGGDGLAPAVLVTGLPGPVILGEPDDAGLVDDEGAPVGVAALLVEDAVRLGDRAVRPEVGQQRELVPLPLGPDLVRRRGVDADGQDLDARRWRSR